MLHDPLITCAVLYLAIVFVAAVLMEEHQERRDPNFLFNLFFIILGIAGFVYCCLLIFCPNLLDPSNQVGVLYNDFDNNMDRRLLR